MVILLSSGKSTCPGLTDKWNFEPCILLFSHVVPLRIHREVSSYTKVVVAKLCLKWSECKHIDATDCCGKVYEWSIDHNFRRQWLQRRMLDY